MPSNSIYFAEKPTPDYAERIKALRSSLGVTQEILAARLGISFATVNRWENAVTKPSQVFWNQLRILSSALQEPHPSYAPAGVDDTQRLDFTTEPEVIRTLVEGERLSFGHLMNPAFAIEISSIDPLPHQRIAVYDHMLKQSRLRFLLADDAGAGKTIMSGLYIREMFSRRLLRRVLIVTPAGLVGNWRRELMTLFNLPFRVLVGNDFRTDNPFTMESGDRCIISVDTLATERVFKRLSEDGVTPYDLVIFDEAHKLAADRGSDLRVRKTERYSLAEAIAGVATGDERWLLPWSAHHLLLLTATPHMGKDYPYYALWRLLQPETLSTFESFADYPAEQRSLHFIRRTKEEMVYLDGRPLYPKRISNTLGYELSQGESSEQALYDETTNYLRFVYNRAKLLNREAARLAMGVFQRRLASSTFALLSSFDRRIAKLDKLILDVRDGKLTTEHLMNLQNRITENDDVLASKSADEEAGDKGLEENEISEEKLLQGVVASSLSDLIAEKEVVKRLRDLAKNVVDAGIDSKFEKLREALLDPLYTEEKFIVFTEHRDTLRFLVRTLGAMGYTDQVAQIHGGMIYTEREEQVDRFRKPLSEGGARFLICTDAAGEGINLQFCWIMVNYDIPWNPARLEQRMGRIHRYGQKHDPVVIMNLVAPKTREGQVLKILLEKLERIRKELKSDKVFDCIGRIFSGVSIMEYMALALADGVDAAVGEVERRLTIESVKAFANSDHQMFGQCGDVVEELPRLREDIEHEVYFRLLPGYVRQYMVKAAPLVGVVLNGSPESQFGLEPVSFGTIDPILPAFEIYPEKLRDKLSISRPIDKNTAIWIHPGEPIFENFRKLVTDKLGEAARRGGLFIDPASEKPYLFHLGLITVLRKSDDAFPEFDSEEVLETLLVAARQYDGSEIELCPVEQLLLLTAGAGIPAEAQRLASAAEGEKEHVRAFLTERVGRAMAVDRRLMIEEDIDEREEFLRRGFDFQEAELAEARIKQSEKARSGNRKAAEILDEVKKQQRALSARRENAIAALRREPELIAPGSVQFLAHALVVPSDDPAVIEEHKENVEMTAMGVARVFEEALGATVLDVHTRDLALQAGLSEYPGFDLLSIHRDGTKRSIEVKGRLGTDEIQMYDNEWAKACNLRDRYWLYVVFDCGTPKPNLHRIQEPFGKLLAKQFSSERTRTGTQVVSGVRISPRYILEAAETI